MGGVTPTKPGSASLPFFGIEPAIIDPVSGEEIHGNDVEGVLAFKQPWPSMARTVWGAHRRYMETYLNVYKGYYVSLKNALPQKKEKKKKTPRWLLTLECVVHGRRCGA